MTTALDVVRARDIIAAATAAGPEPALRALSLGAGVQSTTLYLLSAEGRIPPYDVALFADTGWEPRSVYDHLARLEAFAGAGAPIERVRNPGGTPGRPTGNLRDDSLTPGAFVRIPVFVKSRDRSDASMVRRQCTNEYKVVPIKAAIREHLGYPHPKPVPAGVFCEQHIGISTDEAKRAKDADVRYLRNVFPLLWIGMPDDIEPLRSSDGRLGWRRADCLRYLRSRGWESTPKSACIGCPFHGPKAWRDLRDNHPEDWQDAVDFDRQLRVVQLRGIKEAPYLHRSLLPLDEAPIDRVTRAEHTENQVDLFDAIADDEEDEVVGCSPWGCRDDGL